MHQSIAIASTYSSLRRFFSVELPSTRWSNFRTLAKSPSAIESVLAGGECSYDVSGRQAPVWAAAMLVVEAIGMRRLGDVDRNAEDIQSMRHGSNQRADTEKQYSADPNKSDHRSGQHRRGYSGEESERETPGAPNREKPRQEAPAARLPWHQLDHVDSPSASWGSSCDMRSHFATGGRMLLDHPTGWLTWATWTQADCQNGSRQRRFRRNQTPPMRGAHLG